MKNFKLLKRIGAGLCAAVVVLTSINAPALVKNVSAATSGPSENSYISASEINKLKGKKIFFDNNNDKWYVVGIDTDGSSITATIVSDPQSPLLTGIKYYDGGCTSDIRYKNSTIYDKLDELLESDRFSDSQLDIMRRITNDDGVKASSRLFPVNYGSSEDKTIKANNKTINLGSEPYSDCADFWLFDRDRSISENSLYVKHEGDDVAIASDQANKEKNVVAYAAIKLDSLMFAAKESNSSDAYRLFFKDDAIKSTVEYSDNQIDVSYNASDGSGWKLYAMGNIGGTDWLLPSVSINNSNLQYSTSQASTATGKTISSFENSNIWIAREKNGLLYAKNATEKSTDVEITSITISDIDAPIAGETFDTTFTCRTEGIDLEKTKLLFAAEGADKSVSSGSKAKYNTIYKVQACIYLKPGYYINVNSNNTTNCTVSILGEPYVLRWSPDNKLYYAIHTFPATAKAKLQSITNPSAKTVAAGAKKTAAGLGLDKVTTVTITTEDTTVKKANVKTWKVDSCSYNPDSSLKQTFEVEGEVECPTNIDQNNVSLVTKISVTVNGSSVVAPTASPAAGDYTASQSITLTTTTSGATIYYTTDGTEPTTSSTKYTAAVPMEGKTGYAITKTLKAIAVKDNVKSTTSSFRYKVTITSTATGTTTGTTGTTTGTTGTTTGRTTTSSYYDDSDDEDPDDLDEDADDADDDADDSDESSDGPGPWDEYLTGGYEMLNGMGSVWNFGAEEGLSIRGEGALDSFLAVLVDNEEVDSEYYYLEEGSTIVNFTAEYLEGLSEGEHSVDMIWEDGSASTYFTVADGDYYDEGEEEGYYDEDGNWVEEGDDEWSDDEYYEGHWWENFYWEDVPIWVWIIAILIPLIIIGVIIFLVIRKNKKKKKAAADDEDEDPKKPVKQKKPKKEKVAKAPKEPKKPKEPKAPKEKAPKDPNKKSWFLLKKKKPEAADATAETTVPVAKDEAVVPATKAEAVVPVAKEDNGIPAKMEDVG